MKATLCVLILVPFLVYSQVISDPSEDELHDSSRNVFLPVALTIHKSDLRGNNELWNKIKNKSIEAWNYIKQVANKTKEKISEWKQNVQNHADTIKKTIKEHLNKLGDNIKATIASIKGTNQAIKECLKKEQREINNIIKNVLNDLAKCLARNIENLASLTENQSKITNTVSEENSFKNDLDNKLAFCEQTTETSEECIYTVVDEVYTNLDEMDIYIMSNRSESRSIADKISLALISCSFTSLIDSSTLITQEVAEIVKCVKAE